MRITLAASLAQAVEDVKAFHTVNINVPTFMEWVDKYQVHQKRLEFCSKYEYEYVLFYI